MNLAPFPPLSTFIKSISTPFLLARTSTPSHRLRLAPGINYTIGRSKQSCDIVFLDPRISRQHCQLYLDPHSHSLILLDGAAPGPILPIQGEHNANGEEWMPYKGDNGKNLKGEFHTEDKLSFDSYAKRRKHSLNGIFVNGEKIASRIPKVLASGDEVSLLGPTQSGRSLDSNCRLEVGFIVETDTPTKNSWSAQSCVSAVTQTFSGISKSRNELKMSAINGIEQTAPTSACFALNADRLNDDKIIPQQKNRVEEHRNHFSDLSVQAKCYESEVCLELLKAGDPCLEKRCIEPGSKTRELGSALVVDLDRGEAHKTKSRAKQFCDAGTNENVELEIAANATKAVERGPSTLGSPSRWMNLDSTFVSTLNLIRASMRLRRCVSEILNNHNSDDASKGPTELQLTGAGKKSRFRTGRRTSHRKTKRVSLTLSDSFSEMSPSSFGYASLTASLSDSAASRALAEPGRDAIVERCIVNVASPKDVDDDFPFTERMELNALITPEANDKFVNSLGSGFKDRREFCEHTYSRWRAPESSQVSFPQQNDLLKYTTGVETESNIADREEKAIHGKRKDLLGGFSPSQERLRSKRRELSCDTRQHPGLSGDVLRVDLKGEISQLTTASIVARMLDRDVQMCCTSEDTLNSSTVLHNGGEARREKHNLLTPSGISGQACVQYVSNSKFVSCEGAENFAPSNTGGITVASEDFDVKTGRCNFDSLHVGTEEVFSDGLGKQSSEFARNSPCSSPCYVVDICQLIVEDQIGKFEDKRVNMRAVCQGNGKTELDGQGAIFVCPQNHSADGKDLQKGHSLCISTEVNSVEDHSPYLMGCNGLKRATLGRKEPPSVQGVCALPEALEMKGDDKIDHAADSQAFSYVTVASERDERICSGHNDVNACNLTPQMSAAEIKCSSPKNSLGVMDSKKEEVTQEGAILYAHKEQSEVTFRKDSDNFDLKEATGEVRITKSHWHHMDDKSLAGNRSSTEVEPFEDVSIKSMDIETTNGTTNLSLDKMYQSQVDIVPPIVGDTIVCNNTSEGAGLIEDPEHDLELPNLCQQIASVTKASCGVTDPALHDNLKQYNDLCNIDRVDVQSNLDRAERGEEVVGACVDQGLRLHLTEIKDQMDKAVKRTGLQVWQLQADTTHSSGYFLNQLKDAAPDASGQHINVSLWDLLAPIEDIQALFLATFTYDLPWFLSFSGLSPDIPVTVACHDAERCWSPLNDDRCEKPYLDWPNVTLVYPPFPSLYAIGKGSKRRGMGCHHPKMFLVRRISSLRVIVSSANLTSRQWFDVTNNVWWQDFPCRSSPDFQSLFREEKCAVSATSGDFASQLATFLAALLIDAPSEAHWVTDLASFDFSCAVGSLVASVPGLHRPLYPNAPEFLMSLERESLNLSQHHNSCGSKHLGIVATKVVGIRYRFSASADPKGVRIRALAAILNDSSAHVGLTMPVLLKRAKHVAADPNAVSVVVTSEAKGCSQDLFLQEDLHNADINTMESDALQSDEDFVKLGFLPRDVASWLAVLCDAGFFSFAACIWPREALAVAAGQCDGEVKLALYVFQGPKFSMLASSLLTDKETTAFGGLLQSLHRPWGLWRLEQVLSKYYWQDSQQTDFFFGASSIGTSLDAKFLAAFAAAAGRRALSSKWSQESDPEWGCWTAEQEADNPSMGIVFPSIERVKRDNFSHYGLLCFAESTWERLKSAHLLHDAVPYPPEREGFPMHSKVARRRFQQSPSSPPYGWFYCGSHNFSPAAWGRPTWRAADGEAATDAGSVLGSSLQIANYELGIVLIEPPPRTQIFSKENEVASKGLDRFVMPFQVPPPKYKDRDRPATGRAMYEAFSEMRELQLRAAEQELALMLSEVPLEEEGNREEELNVQEDAGNPKAEQEYAEALWSQIEDQGG